MKEKQRILVVDDDENIAELIGLYLNKECFETKLVYDGEQALEAVKDFAPNLVLLDIMLPGIDGYEVLREIRRGGSLPVIMLSAKGETFDRVLGLELGADDYITKPYSLPVLMARIKNTLKRTYRSETSSEIEYNGLKLDLSNCTVMYNNVCVELSKRETQILCYLLNHAGHYVSRISLIEHLWNTNQYIDDNTLSVNVTRIREKLSRLGLSGFIQTKRGMGYKV